MTAADRDPLAWVKAAMDALAAYEADYGERLPDDHELGRIDESRGSPSFRLRVGHIRRLAAHAREAGAQEPVAWRYSYVWPDGNSTDWLVQKSYPYDRDGWTIEPLFTHPAPAQEPVAVPAGFVLVPKTIIAWLLDEGPGRDGQWINAGEMYNPNPIWWRAELRDWLAAAPVSPPAEQKVFPRDFEPAGGWPRRLAVGDIAALKDGRIGKIEDVGVVTYGLRMTDGEFITVHHEAVRLLLDLWSSGTLEDTADAAAVAARTRADDTVGTCVGAWLEALASTPAPQPYHLADTGKMVDPQPGSEPKGCPTPGACSCPQPGGAVKVGGLIAAARRYMLAVKRLGEDSGYNRLSFFEAPISKMPNDDLGMEAVERWTELNDAGKDLTAACDLASSALSPSPSGWDAGAEAGAMREACADYHDRAAAQWRLAGSEAMARIHERHAKALRALPLPTPPAGEG